MRAKEPPCPKEHDEQAAYIDWCLNFCPDQDAKLTYAVGNELRIGGRKGQRQGARMNREGRREGMLDTHTPVARGPYIGLYVEMKRQKGGSISGAQKWWIAALTKAGHRCVVARGAAEAITEATAYLRLPRRLPLPSHLPASAASEAPAAVANRIR